MAKKILVGEAAIREVQRFTDNNAVDLYGYAAVDAVSVLADNWRAAILDDPTFGTNEMVSDLRHAAEILLLIASDVEQSLLTY